MDSPIGVKHRRGDVHPETGKVFWQYMKGFSSGEYWVTPELFRRHQAAALVRSRKFYADRSASSRAKLRRQQAAYHRHYQKLRRLTDPMFNLKSRVRSRVSNIFRRRGWKKTDHCCDLVGCDWETLKKHMEQQFLEGMSWSNRGQWHIDHRMPLSSAKTLDELKKLCHYTNLQPLWAVDNLAKRDKIPFTLHMNSETNKVTVDFASNPELAEVFVDKKPGDKCCLTIEFSIDEINNESAVGSINVITSRKGKGIKPDYKSPVMILMSAKGDPEDTSKEPKSTYAGPSL